MNPTKMADDDGSSASDFEDRSCVGSVDEARDDSDKEDSKESSSESDLGSDSDGTSESESDDDSDGEKPNDGISNYERLRLERIKRNQQRLAALGLQDESLKPKPQKSHRRKSVERKGPLEPTRKQSSRASKKRVDYSEQPKLHEIISRKPKSKKDSENSVLDVPLFKPPPKELTPEELKRREKRRKERKPEERIPRFIYNEFQRIRSKRNKGLKMAKRLFTKAEREKNHWIKMSRKLEARQRKREAVMEKEAQKRREVNEIFLEEQAEREELDCKGMTKKELLCEIEERTPELLAILSGHKKEQSATLKKLKQEAKEKEEIRKRESLERKQEVIDALDRYPKAMNEALTKLNTLLYSRAPKDSMLSRYSVRRKHGGASDRSPSTTITFAAAMEEEVEPRKKKQKRNGGNSPSISMGVANKASTKNKSMTSNKRDSIRKKVETTASTTTAGKQTNVFDSNDIMKTQTNDSVTVTKKKRGRPPKIRPIHSNDEIEKNSSKAAKRQRKPRDARFVGGWISPKFAKELNRTWLERTKPIDNHPVVLVPDDAAKLSKVSAKKTAVFDLGSYVPQAGDIILYYPSAHRDVLNVHPDTLGSRQRNLLRVPLWARANRDRNRLIKEDEKGTIWWTDEWIESLTTQKNSKKERQLDISTRTQGSFHMTDVARGESSKFEEETDDEPIRTASLGDYPIICRVEKTYAEFPEDPYAKEKKRIKNEEAIDYKGKGDGTKHSKKSTSGPNVTAKTRSSVSAEAGRSKPRFRVSTQIRLALMLKPLSPIIPPYKHKGQAVDHSLGMPPTFSVVTFPVDKFLEPFIIPFCWAYASFHLLKSSERVWIHRSTHSEKNGGEDKLGLEGKGKIIDFVPSASVQDREGEEDSISLSKNMNDLKELLAALAKDETIPNEVVGASLLAGKEQKGTIPVREANILIGFLRKYFQQFEHKKNYAKISVPLQSSSTETVTTMPSPSLVSFILRTLPLRQGVLVAYDSNRRQKHRVSPWNLVSLQPTELSYSVQDGLLGHLENAFREKAILCLEDFIANNYQAQVFVPMITELIAPAYYNAVPVGMSLGRVLARLKAYGKTGSCYYTSLRSILMDMNLILENCLLYNNPDSEVVSQCRDIIPRCQTLIKGIIQNRNLKASQTKAVNQAGTKRSSALISSLLNTPYTGNLNWEWLQQLTPFFDSSKGETVTRRATSSTWIPQCGELVLYSKKYHSQFISSYQECLDEFQSSVPSFQHANYGKKNQKTDESQLVGNYDEFYAKTSTHWLEGTVMSVRTSFPRHTTQNNATPILIVELRLHYDQYEGHIVVCWRPSFDGMKYKGSGLAGDSFLRPHWMTTGEMKILPSTHRNDIIVSPISKEMSISIAKCFDFLKKRCIDGILPETVNPELALEKAEHDIACNFDSQHLPSFPEFFTPVDMKYGMRAIRRIGYRSALQVLSKVGYMPLWACDIQQNPSGRKKTGHESWMPFPSLCLELIRLRISNGYYKHFEAISNDISESYVATVLYLLSRSLTRNSDGFSIRKIAKYLMSPKGNGKMTRIAIKKKSKRKTDESTNSPKKQPKSPKQNPFDKLTQYEEELIQQIYQIRRYHAAAIVFALEARHIEKIFCLVSTPTPSLDPDALSDIDQLTTSDLTLDQQDGVNKIRKLLHATRRDQCRNRFKFPDRDIYKVRIKCGERLLAENGEFEKTSDGSLLFEPNTIKARLPGGSRMKLTIKCGNQDVWGEKKIVAAELLSQISDPTKFYLSSEVGLNHLSFSFADLKDNEGLLRTLFGRPGRMHPCVRCQLKGASFYSCRVLRQHSNSDYDLTKHFKGTTGVDSLLRPWNHDNGERSNDMVVTESVEALDGKPAAILHHTDEVITEERSPEDKETKEVLVQLEEKVKAATANMQKTNEAYKLASYLYAQASLLSDLEVKLSEDFISTKFPVDPADNHYVFCIHCGCAGDLLICDGCPNVSHAKCAGLECVPEGDWFCHKCSVSTSDAKYTEKSSSDIEESSKQKISDNGGEIKEIYPNSIVKIEEKVFESPIDANRNRIENLEEQNRTLDPEINDKEFDEIASQLSELLTGLISERLPHKTKSIEEEKEDCKFLEALGKSYVREFLSFIGIESGEELLSTRTGLIATDLKMWRKEKGMKPLTSMGYGSTVSGWKKVVRKAMAIENNDNNQKNPDYESPRATKTIASGLEALPAQGLKFCSDLGISDSDAFLAMRTTDLAKNYTSWRKKEKMPKLVGDGASAYMSTWKAKIRNATSSSSSKPAIDEKSRSIRMGFKVRKLFDDGNYYEGKVISGPSEAYDEDKRETVLCWRVKYVDDDEEEFTVDELNQWGIQKATTGGSKRSEPRSAKVEKSEEFRNNDKNNKRPREGRRRSSRLSR